jgi:hypothetical protein
MCLGKPSEQLDAGEQAFLRKRWVAPHHGAAEGRVG